MTALVGAYVLWRIVRRLLPLALIAAVALVVLAPHARVSGSERRLRRDLAAEVRQAQQSIAHLLEQGLRRRR